MKINLLLGIENFAELIENGCYYIDKTLTMSMLEAFFDIQKDSAGKIGII